MFVRNTMIGVLSYAITTLLSMVTYVVLARGLGPQGSGAVALLSLFSVSVCLIINLGLGQSAVYFIGQRTYDAKTVSGNMLRMAMLIGIPATLILALAQPLYGSRLLGNIPEAYVLAVALLTTFALARMYAEYMFAAVHDFIWYTGLNIVDLAVRLVLLLVLLQLGAGLKGAVIAMATGMIVSAILGWELIRRRIGGLRTKISRPLLRRFSSFGLLSYASVFTSYMNLRFDQFLVGIFLSLEQVGIYGVAVILAEVAMKFANVVAKVLFANVATLSPQSATQLTGRTMRATMVIATLSVAGLALLGPWVIRFFFGEAFMGANSALLFLLPGTLLFNISQVLYSDLSGRGLPQVGIYASIASLAATLLGNYTLTPRLGVDGAAITSSIAYAIGALIILSTYLRTTGENIRQVLVVSREDVRMVGELVRQLTSARWRQNTHP